MERSDYVRRVLEAYRTTAGTSGAVRRADRLLAAQLHERGVPAEAVENALTLAAAGGGALAGLLLSGHRRGASDRGRSGLLPLSARKAPVPHSKIGASLIVESHSTIRPPSAPAARMILPHPSTPTTNTRLWRG
jgi:hypothetical protein